MSLPRGDPHAVLAPDIKWWGLTYRKSSADLDMVDAAFQGKMPGIEQMDFGLRLVAPERFRARRQKNGSFLPHTERSGGRAVRSIPGISSRGRRC